MHMQTDRQTRLLDYIHAIYNIEKAINLGPTEGLAETKSPATQWVWVWVWGWVLGSGLQTTEVDCRAPLPCVGPTFRHRSKG